MAVFNAWQMRWQGLTTRAQTPGFGNGVPACASACSTAVTSAAMSVFGAGFLEQISLDTGQRFVFDAIAEPPQMRQFQNEGLDFEVFGLNIRFVLLSLLFHLIKQRLNQCRHLCFSGCIEVQFIQSVQYFHGGTLPQKRSLASINTGFTEIFSLQRCL